VVNLLGDPTKARTVLGWNPRKTSFEELVHIMVAHDMEYVQTKKTPELIKEAIETGGILL
jgi:GDPmannose 4,6-dehydratase